MERLVIESMLRDGKTVYAMAKALSRPASTVMREIKSRMVESEKGAAYRIKNRCAKSRECLKRRICAQCLHVRPGRAGMLCRLCNQCNSRCTEFVEQRCERLEKPPFVCNGCGNEPRCVLRKRFYIHSAAQKNYETILSESRTGANLTEGEIAAFDKLLHRATLNGQSVRAAMLANPDKFTVSDKSIYRYINGGLLLTKRHNLPRVCKLKPRKAKSAEHRVDKSCRIGRTHDDCLAFMEANKGIRVVQMDTVEGVKGGKVLLTLMFNPFGFMVAILLEAKTSECVSNAFRRILAALEERFGKDGGREMFSRLFPVILTDNGSEFSNPKAIEFDAEGNRLTCVFYCDPYASWQKAQVERNHVEVRRILPKGTVYTEPTSFDGLSQNDVSLMMSHLNGHPEQSLKAAPYDLFAREYGEEAASSLGVFRVKANDVVLKSSLLGIEVKVKEWVKSL